ncbi:EthD family reductase [Paraburkholderia sp.]|uniref:EthD family reductase n=1 Tax=Paraburkholderia sp. TaxID=1926495 RepID=UPI00238836F9|nr:EthD family reductase [Paraburkholderia sp.]MDE1179136.1 EthD family reductase [Paraburkholderia sp.]
MAKLVVLYKNPSDPNAFDDHYFTTHVQLAKKLPGLERYEVSAGPIKPVGGQSEYYLIATLHFASTDAIAQALNSPAGKAAAADLGNFAQAGAELLMFETKDV